MRRAAAIGVAAALLAAAAPSAAQGFGVITTWGTNGAAPGQFGEPADVAVDEDFDVYVADRFNNRVQVFSPLGAFRRMWSTRESFGLHVGRGLVVLSEFNGDGVSRFSTAGVFQKRWGTLGTPADPQPRYREPWDVDVGPDGLVYTADSVNGRIVVTTIDGAFVRSMGDGMLSSPFGVAAEPSGGGSVWVADSGNDRIIRLDPGGTFHVTNGPGAGNGQVNLPWDVAFDPNGDLLVTDRGNSRVQRLTRGGAFIEKFGTAGGGPQQFSSPQGLAVDAAGNVYVADAGNNRIVRWGDRANLRVTVTASRPALTVGEDVVVTLRVENAGPDPARFVRAHFAPPGHLAPVALAATQGGCGEPATAGCALGTIPAGGAAAASATLRATAPGPATVTGTAGGPTFDPDVTDNSAPAIVTAAAAAPPPPPPPPPAAALQVVNSRVVATWRRSRVRGRLIVTLQTPRPARVRIDLLRGPAGRARLARATVRLRSAGRSTHRVALRRSTPPGRHVLRVREIGAPAGARLTGARVRVRLRPPPEGVVARAFISRGVGGRGVTRITGRVPSFLFANFRFAAVPRNTRRLRVVWYWSGRRGPVATNRLRPVRGLAVSPLRNRRGALPSGRYRAVLRHGGRPVAVASVRLG